jgi:hypothetical protein
VAARHYEPRGFPRQVLDSGQSLLVIFAGVLLIACVAQTAVAGVRDARTALVFGALIAFGEVLRLNLPGERESAPIATAGALAYAMLIRVGTTTVHLSAQQVVSITATGMIVGALRCTVVVPTRISMA